MIRWVAAYIASGAVFIAGDLAWVTLMGPRLYRPTLGPILADSFRPGPAVAFYLIYLTGVLAFGVAPGLKGGGWTGSLMWGALFGLAAYATYDLTNQATMKVWSTPISVVDIGWGALITGLASVAGCLAAQVIARR